MVVMMAAALDDLKVALLDQRLVEMLAASLDLMLDLMMVELWVPVMVD
jgi:hypothetical protein